MFFGRKYLWQEKVLAVNNLGGKYFGGKYFGGKYFGGKDLWRCKLSKGLI